MHKLLLALAIGAVVAGCGGRSPRFLPTHPSIADISLQYDLTKCQGEADLLDPSDHARREILVSCMKDKGYQSFFIPY